MSTQQDFNNHTSLNCPCDCDKCKDGKCADCERKMKLTYNDQVAALLQEAGGVGRVIGARLLVKDVIPIDEVSAWANRTGLHAVVYDNNKPKPTEGIVLGIGSDPLLQEEAIKIGDHVFFSKHAGHFVYEEGRQFRSLELQEITRIKDRKFFGWKDEEGGGENL